MNKVKRECKIHGEGDHIISPTANAYLCLKCIEEGNCIKRITSEEKKIKEEEK